METTTETYQEPMDATSAARPATGEGLGAGLAVLREWTDALLVAFVLAMFVRIFLVELFKIPTGSMTPTLIGGEIARFDADGDGRLDLLLLNGADTPLLFVDRGDRMEARGEYRLTWNELRMLEERDAIATQSDRILVNKFAYWFHPPRRGDIVVFKVPDVIWERGKPIYIKRCVGRPGETLRFTDQGRLIANDWLVTDPAFFLHQSYVTLLNCNEIRMIDSSARFVRQGVNHCRLVQIQVPDDAIYVFGDNSHSSLDSRYWGSVPLNHVKGKAFFRYFPLNQMKLLKS